MRLTAFAVLPVCFFTALLVSGCSTLLNPYEAEFSCPEPELGKCVSVQTAYKESFLATPPKPQQNSDADDCVECRLAKRGGDKKEVSSEDGQAAAGPSTPVESEYQEALYKRVTSLLKAPVTPMVVAPQVMRVLLLPYVSDADELYMGRYTFFFVDKPRWSIGDYLVDKGER